MKEKKQFIIANSIVINPEGKILLVQRNRPKHESHKKWEFAGGKVEWGEDPRQTAIRETKEETGYTVEDPRQIGNILSLFQSFDTHESHIILIGYLCKLKLDERIETNDKNVLDIRWFLPSDVLKMDCLIGTKTFTKEIIKIMEGN